MVLSLLPLAKLYHPDENATEFTFFAMTREGILICQFTPSKFHNLTVSSSPTATSEISIQTKTQLNLHMPRSV